MSIAAWFAVGVIALWLGVNLLAFSMLFFGRRDFCWASRSASRVRRKSGEPLMN
jgi:hypothetical protein